MNKRILLITTCALASFAMALAAGPKKKVHTIGDSTMSEYATDGSTDKCGWGQMLQQFFNSESVVVNNRAKAGASSKSFYKEPGYWNTLVKGGKDEMKAGDFLLIQFAHNDEKNNGADGDELKKYFRRQGAASRAGKTDYRGTTAYETFRTYIHSFIEEAKAMGVKPIVVAPIARNYFSSDGSKITRSGKHDLGDNYSAIKDNSFLEELKVGPNDHTYDYVQAAKEVAEEFDDVPFINLTELTAKMYEKYGYSYCSKKLFSSSDKTHTAALGANLIAHQFVIQLKKQAESEADPKKKAILAELAEGLDLSNSFLFSPSDGDMGLAYIGAEVDSKFTVSAFDMPSEYGNAKISADNGFLVSLDKYTWSESVNVKYTNYTLMSPIYIRANTTTSGFISCKLTVTDGTRTSTKVTKIEVIDPQKGENASATWQLTQDSKKPTSNLLEASEIKLSEMFIEDFQMEPVSPTGHSKMVLFNVEGGTWPGVYSDEVPTRYIEFKATVPKGKIMNLSEISLDICGFGGNNTCYNVYCATKDDFSDKELIGKGLKTSKEYCTTINKEFLTKVGEGKSVYIRIYPWMKVTDKVSGKCIGISDVCIKGKLFDAPPPPPAPKNTKTSARTTKPAAKPTAKGTTPAKPRK